MLNGFKHFYLTCSSSIYQVFLSNTNKLHVAVGFQIIIIIILSKWLNNSIWPIDGILTGIPTLGWNRLERHGNEGVLHIPQTSGSLSDLV